MRFELFLVMIFFLSILLICAELLWLYLLADNQEESKAKLNKKDLNKWAKNNPDKVAAFGHYEPVNSLIIK